MLWLHACMLLQHNVQVLEGIYVFASLQTFLMARYNYMYFSINLSMSRQHPKIIVILAYN